MKKFLLSLFMICAGFACLFADSKYYTGNTGSDIVLAIPEARGKYLAEEQQYLKVLLQTQLTDTIKKFSPITVVDRQNEDIADSEISKSEDGSYSDSDYAEFGKKLNAKYVAATQIINMEDNYQLSIRIIETEKNSIAWNHSSTVNAREVKTGLAINKAVKDILSQIGVQLTEEANTALNGGVDEKTLKAQENLSKGINASKRGTTIEAMQYYYAAAEYNLDNSEINSRLNAIQSAVSSGNLGDMARGEDEAYDYWLKTLKEADDYFVKNPPYEIAYSKSIKRLERTEAELKAKENSVQIEIGLIASNNSKNTIKALNQGISNSPDVVRKACSKWPNKSLDTETANTWMNPKACTVTVQLINDIDKVIAERDVPLSLIGPGLLDSKVIQYSDLSNLVKVDLHNIKSKDITDGLTIKIKTVIWDGKKLSTDYIRISTVEELREPLEAAMKAERDRQAREEELRKAREIAEQQRKEKERIAKEKKAVKEKKAAARREKHALSNRTAWYWTADVPSNLYTGNVAAGTTIGYDRKLFANVFWGVSGGFFMNAVSEAVSATGIAEMGFSYGLNPNNSIYIKAGIGGATPNYPTGAGLLYRGEIGWDWTVIEMAYSLEYVQGKHFADRFVIGLVFPKAWFDSL